MGPQWGRNASVAANTVNKERAGRAALVNSLNVAQFFANIEKSALKIRPVSVRVRLGAPDITW